MTDTTLDTALRYLPPSVASVQIAASTLRQIRKGLRRTFTTRSADRLAVGKPVRLHAGAETELLLVTALAYESKATGWRVTVEHAEWRAKESPRFLSATWPDYTGNAGCSMFDEPEPVPETEAEAKDRAAWEALGYTPQLCRLCSWPVPSTRHDGYCSRSCARRAWEQRQALKRK